MAAFGSLLRRYCARLTLATVSLAAASAPALADMGLAPSDGRGFYGSIEGGYLHQRGDDVIGHGVNTAPGAITDLTVSADNGWFAGAMIGRSLATRLWSFQRIEFYGHYGRTDDDASTSVPPAVGTALKNVDATQLVELGDSGRTSTERSTFEGGFRLEHDEIRGEGRSLTWVLAPFLRVNREETSSIVTGCCVLERHGDVDTRMLGAYVAVEPEIKLHSGLSLVGRLGAGLYGYDADGKFRSADDLNGFFVASVNDDDRGIGFRGLLGLGLKMQLAPHANLETFAEADYFSHVGTARMPNNQPGDLTPARTGTSDLWELRAGLRLNMSLGSGD